MKVIYRNSKGVSSMQVARVDLLLQAIGERLGEGTSAEGEHARALDAEKRVEQATQRPGDAVALGAGPLILPMLFEAARSDYMRSLPADDPFRLSARRRCAR